ncbi:MAG: hypothetical protein JXA04_02340 [Gammaproteobacteria bacterium]|nr:hypothetical protein [Gammaproteobacteria bacterium]
MIRVSKGMMQALQRYTPEYKEEILNRAERTWRPIQAENRESGTEENVISEVRNDFTEGQGAD